MIQDIVIEKIDQIGSDVNLMRQEFHELKERHMACLDELKIRQDIVEKWYIEKRDAYYERKRSRENNTA